MKIFIDKYNRKLRLSDERLHHILKRAEMKNQEDKIKETSENPDCIKCSLNEKSIHLLYKHYPKTPVTSKYLLVAVKISNREGFIITSFFTDKIKRGEMVWKR